MAWEISCTVEIEDEAGVRRATAGEVQVRLIRGGTGGVSSLAADTDQNGEVYFTACPAFIGTSPCTIGVWGIKYIHKQTGKWIAGNLTLLDGTYGMEWTEEG